MEVTENDSSALVTARSAVGRIERKQGHERTGVVIGVDRVHPALRIRSDGGQILTALVQNERARGRRGADLDKPVR